MAPTEPCDEEGFPTRCDHAEADPTFSAVGEVTRVTLEPDHICPIKGMRKKMAKGLTAATPRQSKKVKPATPTKGCKPSAAGLIEKIFFAGPTAESVPRWELTALVSDGVQRKRVHIFTLTANRSTKFEEIAKACAARAQQGKCTKEILLALEDSML